ncbi:sigma-54 interaction domain-containing protein [Billgrantia kenyensis]|uniref:Sigma-54-dependent Fis family transcriptional regulator n=1 Tax=Billgrantia kenyensis TaxID=321266 RepID=A0A7V9VYQ5_9GAMM|nr:sigma-54 dependent transcriptional regulator [Halomonas kenyensis]MBA2777860.1 sigma-54-dependent Fis family transcriptional regulator [Halomonas kenyensis]MCG6661331.1 sigma-54-dependent Fis family transcriptional regulator [Halomonas kenyensis]
METPPNVMLLDRTFAKSSWLRDELHSEGYLVSLCKDLEQAFELKERKHFDVGVLIMAKSLPPLLELERFILDCNFDWVALLEPQHSMSAEIRHMLGQLFHSVVDPNHLPVFYCLLGHAARRQAIGLASKRNVMLSVNGKRVISSSPCMQRMVERLEIVADVDAPVYISGESGTGKELAARAIHECSARAKAPFIAVNCGAIPTSLIQSELFGYEKGAFTDAHRRRTGKIEAADGGTLFLDEISELPYELQVNFLRFIESRSISRLGSHREILADIRIISASNKHIAQLVEDGRFRADLYYRLNVLEIRVPPLRERKQDIEPLVRLFFEQLKQYQPPGLKGISPQAMSLLHEHDWPGNIRELMNTLCRAMLMSNGPFIEADDLPFGNTDEPHRPPTLEEIRQQAERSTIISALKRNRYNVARASRELAVSRVTLYRLMEKYDIQRLDNFPGLSRSSST